MDMHRVHRVIVHMLNWGLMALLFWRLFGSDIGRRDNQTLTLNILVGKKWRWENDEMNSRKKAKKAKKASKE